MPPKYSVIIPVYNAEKTLSRCLDSLINENYSNMEILLVNDGSIDSSGKICEKYLLENNSIRYVKKDNAGVASARNIGIDLAKGEYVVFVDSDDYVAVGFFSALDDMLQDESLDLVQFSWCIENGKEKKNRVFKPLKEKSREKSFNKLIDAICKKTINSPCAKVYRRNIIKENNIRFLEGISVAEDRAFNINYSLYVQKYAVSNVVVYCVNTENENSLSRCKNNNLNQQFEVINIFLENVIQKAKISEYEKEQYKRALNFGNCRAIYHDAKLFYQDNLRWSSRLKRLGKLCDEINDKRMRFPNTIYCKLITLPVRARFTMVIDAIAWKLTH